MRWFTLIAVVVVLVLVVLGVKGCGVFHQIQQFQAQGQPKQTVSAMKAGFQDWNQSLSAVASLRAVRGADLSSEVNGIVDAIHFESGQDVAAGTLLLSLRAGDDIAHLDSLKATAGLARINFQRDQRQFEAQAISRAALDSDEANLKSAEAQVAEQQALVEKKMIRAPFAGHLGIRAVDPGEYLAAGAKMVTLQQLDPIYVDFSLPQQQLGQLASGQKVEVNVDSFPDHSFEGAISAIDPKIDSDTRNLSVRATLANPDHKLLPGMFAKVQIQVGAPVRYLTLPETAVTYNPYGDTVYVVVPKSKDAPKDDKSGDGKDDKSKPKDAAAKPAAKPASEQGAELVAKQVFITTGPTRGDQVAIIKGLNEGDEVVTSGQIKLKNGDSVVIDNTVQPSNDANPTPQEQ